MMKIGAFAVSYCENCGGKIAEDSKFCRNCGHPNKGSGGDLPDPSCGAEKCPSADRSLPKEEKVDSGKECSRKFFRCSKWSMLGILSIALILIVVMGIRLGFQEKEKKIVLAEVAELRGHSGDISSISFNASGNVLASTGGEDGTLRLWSVPSGQLLENFRAHRGYIFDAAFPQYSSQEYVATAGEDKPSTVKIWNLKERVLHRTIINRTGNLHSVAFSRDLETMAFSSAGKPAVIKLWDYRVDQEIATLRGHSENVYKVLFSPDGSKLVSGGFDQTIKIWDTNSGLEERTLTGHNSFIFDIAISPDGKLIASAGSNDKTARLWDLATGKELKIFSGMGHVVSVDFSADGKYLATASYDEKGIRIWDVKTGKQIEDNLGNFGEGVTITHVKFSKDGHYIAAAIGGRNGVIKYYRIVSLK